MEEIKQIVTANFTEVDKLLSEDYICVSIIGKVYGEYAREEIQRITSLNTFRHYYHKKAEDWYACNILYRDILKRKGIEKLKADLLNLVSKQNKSKIALLGYGKENEFCYRHILSDYLNANGMNVTEVENVDLTIQKEYWKQNQYKAQGHYNLTDEYVGQILEKSKWIFAKTMAKTNPHWYTLRKNFGNNEQFLHIVAHIRFYGIAEIFEGVLYRVFYYNGYKYWDHPCDILNEDCDLINRKPV
ncbi:hypothetical protein MC378_13790 [Polaribacter sp. MSW13]|uniref:Uncharacterized protein n=1 Tax=Polaribacter marinus TaxID=2916838 RepID=A0A9X1VSZ2_9FLAO|nr:hypothetical protein [Polaribacter marinus]MCI2230245.1 hypothetical protein [Polaribacter marinus]